MSAFTSRNYWAIAETLNGEWRYINSNMNADIVQVQRETFLRTVDRLCNLFVGDNYQFNTSMFRAVVFELEPRS